MLRLLWCLLLLAVAHPLDAEEKFTDLFKTDGPPEGWSVRTWNDLAKPAEDGNQWHVKAGILSPGKNRGTWLLSDREYDDFVLEFEIKLTEHGNSGLALRTPPTDDPAFVALELQIADLRYNPQAKEDELTGALYRAIAPQKQVYKPTEWNDFRVELKGTKCQVVLNGETIQDVDLKSLDKPTKRHDGSEAVAVKDRPLKGRIGFQHLSRNNEPVQIRNVRIKELK